ncbi:MAG TPA: SBBP repeat-containing protein, partial [Planctomycetota bacterium]|nr:SBBP repeat-containing protein [Planctomycetota bacterium]
MAQRARAAVAVGLIVSLCGGIIFTKAWADGPAQWDSKVIWSSFLAGSGSDYGYDINVDPAGNVYIAGRTYSVDLPTAGGFDTVGDGKYGDGFIAKFGSDGSLLWASYIGGSSTDVANGVFTGPDGSVYVTGYTNSSDFPASGGFDSTHNGLSDAFVTKIDPDGHLVWSSFLGGSSTDQAIGICVDGNGNVFVTGNAGSTNFPLPGGLSSGLAGNSDAYVAKISGSGQLVWVRLLGGSNHDYGRAIAADTDGTVVVVGRTMSPNFPKVGGLGRSFAGREDAFVAKLSSAGALLWSSLLGGTGADWANGVSIDAQGCPFLTGMTASTDFPAADGLDQTMG